MITDDSTIYTKRNKYGYQLNINNPLIKPHYERFKRKCDTPILSDEERFEFEEIMFDWLRRKKYI